MVVADQVLLRLDGAHGAGMCDAFGWDRALFALRPVLMGRIEVFGRGGGPEVPWPTRGRGGAHLSSHGMSNGRIPCVSGPGFGRGGVATRCSQQPSPVAFPLSHKQLELRTRGGRHSIHLVRSSTLLVR